MRKHYNDHPYGTRSRRDIRHSLKASSRRPRLTDGRTYPVTVTRVRPAV